MVISREILEREYTLLLEEIEYLKQRLRIEEKHSLENEEIGDNCQKLIKLEERLFKKEITKDYIRRLFNQQ